MDWLEYENKNIARGFLNICGVDEAGRGPLAGPVCAAAVILPENTVIEGVNDSKKLSEKKREVLFDVIKEQALAYSIAFASVEEIEEMNILNATMLAMERAVEGLEPRADYAMIDGNRMPPLSIEGECIVKVMQSQCQLPVHQFLPRYQGIDFFMNTTKNFLSTYLQSIRVTAQRLILRRFLNTDRVSITDRAS